MPGYSSEFDSSPVQLAVVGYNAISLFASVTQFYWPDVSGILPPLARNNDWTPDEAGLVAKLPPANSAALGVDALVTNRGLVSLEIQDFDGTTVATIIPGETLYLYVSANDTQAGTWASIHFGAAIAQAQASALAGAGLTAQSNLLNIGYISKTLSHDYTPIGADRAKCIVWEGGKGTFQLNAVSSYGLGFNFEVRNNGTGTLTIAATTPDLIDTLPQITLQPDESCFIICSSVESQWYTIGRGRSRLFGYTLLTKVLSGGSVTLTPQEASATVQVYTGALTTNAVVNLPPVVQIYFVNNNTTGVFTTTFQVTGGGGTTVTMNPGDTGTFACDGTNLFTVSGKGSTGGQFFGLSIYQFGCKGNGSFDDTTNLNAALTFAGTIATASVPVDLEFNGGQCAISGQLDIPTGVGLRNGGLKALSGGSLNATTPMVQVDSGNNKRITSMLFDCNRQCAGMIVTGAGNFTCDRLQIRNFVGYGIGTRSGCTDVMFVRTVVEEWTAGTAGETDYTQRVAIGFDVQGQNCTFLGCTARYCQVPFKVNASGGGYTNVIGLHTRNGSSGTTKPNIVGFSVVAQGGSLKVSDCIFEDGFVSIVDSWNNTTFQNNNHRSSSESTVVDAYQLKTSTASDNGAGLTITGTRYQATINNMIVQQTTGAGTWATDLRWNVHTNTGAGGGIDQNTLQRMVVPNGKSTSPGLSFEGANTGFYRENGSSTQIGFTNAGLNVFNISTTYAFTLGESSSGSANFMCNGPAATNRGYGIATAGNKRWTIYTDLTAETGSSVGGNLDFTAYADGGGSPNLAMRMERSSGNVKIYNNLILTPSATIPTLLNGEITFVKTDSTHVTMYFKDSGGVQRSFVLGPFA